MNHRRSIFGHAVWSFLLWTADVTTTRRRIGIPTQQRIMVHGFHLPSLPLTIQPTHSTTHSNSYYILPRFPHCHREEAQRPSSVPHRGPIHSSMVVLHQAATEEDDKDDGPPAVPLLRELDRSEMDAEALEEMEQEQPSEWMVLQQVRT